MMEPGTYANLEIDIELKNRTEQDNIYETLQHGTGELADKTTPSAKKCTPLLFWCTLINSILIGLLIIAVSVSLYMCINVSKASNSKESIRSIAADVRNIRNDLENNTSGLDNLMVITDEINKKCEDGLSDLSKNLERQTSELGSSSTESITSLAADVRNIRNDLENNTSGLDNLMVITDEINKKCEDGLSDLSKNLERQTNDLRSSSTESMRNMSEVVANIKKDVENSTSGLDDLKAVTDEVKTICRDGLSDLSKRVASLEKQMKEVDQATGKQSQTVAFNVMDAVNYTDSETMKFSNIILNEGNAYNIETGIFTAPIDGIYQFNAHICGNRKPSFIEYFIKVGTSSIVTGEFVLPSRVTSDSDAKCTSFSAVAMVRKDETVRVGGMPFTSLGRVTGSSSGDFSSFSGVLIKSI